MRIEVQEQSDLALLLTVEIIPTYTRRFIVGQDSRFGPPFVTQVPRSISTLQEAFEYLKPQVVKKAEAAGLAVKRQGDWFFIPWEPPKGPSYRHFVPMNGKWQEVKLDAHILYSQFWGQPEETRHRATEVIHRSTCRHLVRGIVEAPDHEALDLGEEWHLAARRRTVPNPIGRTRADD